MFILVSAGNVKSLETTIEGYDCVILGTSTFNPTKWAKSTFTSGCMNIWYVHNSVSISTSGKVSMNGPEKRCAPPEQSFYYYIYFATFGWSKTTNSWQKLDRIYGQRLWTDSDLSAIDAWGVFNPDDLKGKTCNDFVPCVGINGEVCQPEGNWGSPSMCQ